MTVLGLFVRRGKPDTQEKEQEAAGAKLSDRALAFLATAAQTQPQGDALVIEERAVWQPDSWLLQRCWHELAEYGAAQEALDIAALLEARNPLARVQALYRVARAGRGNSATKQLVAQEIRRRTVALFKPEAAETVFKFTDQLLYVGAAAAQIGNLPLACTCLERLDQLDRPWDRIFIPMETRDVLAETVAHIGLHPLTNALLTMAIRRYEEPGAQFLHQVIQLAAERLQSATLVRSPRRSPHGMQARRIVRRMGRLLQRSVAVFQFSTLATLTTRRLAATGFGRVGAVRDVLEQVETIANVQAARQETGQGGGRSDPHFLRQVKRPTANLDIDFQIYALQEAIKVMPLRRLAREERIELADRVAALATQSDGWTAAGAVATLVELGALRYAVRVIDFIPPTDATRSEGVISLVRALLTFGETQLANEQIEKAIAWAQSLPGRNAERALIWGLAEIFMDFGLPQRAIELLDLRVTPPGFGERMRRMFRNAPNDDQLRDNRLRFQALILQDALLQEGHLSAPQNTSTDNTPVDSGATPADDRATESAESESAAQENAGAAAWTREKETLYRQLHQWAARLLDGESLINFYVEGLLRPLFTAQKIDLVIQLLPQLHDALQHSTGDKHTVHIRKMAALFAQAIDPRQANLRQATPAATNKPASPHLAARPLPNFGPETQAEMRKVCTDFLLELWTADAKRGIWQMVHSLEGSLPLLLALEGPDALVAVAEHTAESGQSWAA